MDSTNEKYPWLSAFAEAHQALAQHDPTRARTPGATLNRRGDFPRQFIWVVSEGAVGNAGGRRRRGGAGRVCAS